MVPRYHLERYGRRSFSVAGLILRNALPHAVRDADSAAMFKTLLKTHLFLQAFVQLCTLRQCYSSDILAIHFIYVFNMMFL